NSPGVDTTGGDCWVPTGTTDDITFSVTGTITLSSSLPTIQQTSLTLVTIDGTGQSITISGHSLYEILYVNSGATLTLNDLTIENGNSFLGGGVFNDGTLTVTNSTLSGNTAAQGGGIFNESTATVTNSTFSGNSA